MYAIVEISGKQYKVRENDRLYVPRLKDELESKVAFDRVLLVAGDEVKVGTPLVEGAQVQATVLAHLKADKVVIFKKKRRKRYQLKNGHRQPYTQLLIDAVSLDGKPAPKKAAVKEAAPKAEKAAAKVEKAAAKAEKAPAKAKAKKAAPKAEKAAAAPAAKKAKKAAKTGDDLTKIEGVGPKIAGILAAGGLDTFKKVAGSDLDVVKGLLEAAGPRYNIAVPDTWAEQAALADAGNWDELKKLQDALDGGRRV